MASVPRAARVSPQTYLHLEREAATKSEYIEGEIVAMAGASREHNLIIFNIGGELRPRLKGRPCEAYTNDMRVRVPSRQLYTYPDVVVACGEPHFERSGLDTLLNPTLVIEVSSPSTEHYDRGKKFRLFRTMPSLQEYILVAQDAPHVERYVRQPNGLWVLDEVDGLDAVLSLEAIGCALPLSEIYDRVEFPEEQLPSPDEGIFSD